MHVLPTQVQMAHDAQPVLARGVSIESQCRVQQQGQGGRRAMTACPVLHAHRSEAVLQVECRPRLLACCCLRHGAPDACPGEQRERVFPFDGVPHYSSTSQSAVATIAESCRKRLQFTREAFSITGDLLDEPANHPRGGQGIVIIAYESRAFHDMGQGRARVRRRQGYDSVYIEVMESHGSGSEPGPTPGVR